MSTQTTSSVLFLGASRGVGFAAYTTLAAERPEVQSILLLRSIERFKSSREGKSVAADILARTTLVEGDAHQLDTIVHALNVAGDNLEAVVSSIGHTPPTDFAGTVKGFMVGFKPNPPDLCCRGVTNLIQAINTTCADRTKPKLIIVSSMGMGAEAHKLLPFGLGWFYSHALQPAHDDKIGMEIVIEKATRPSTSNGESSLPRFFPTSTEALPHILPATTYASIPSNIFEQSRVCVVRPALLTDGEKQGNYRVYQEGKGKEGSSGKKMYSINRKDTGDFVARLLFKEDNERSLKEWWGYQPVLGY